MKAGVSEKAAFETAWSALANEGYKEVDGKWRKNMTEEKKPVEAAAKIIKTDEERKIAWGWASVSTIKGEPVYDAHGDHIPSVEMEKMADFFMLSVYREGLEMHKGNPIGHVLHSFPVTKELAEVFDMKSDYEGWIIGMKVESDAVWDAVKSGKYSSFSIGGWGNRAPAPEDSENA